MPPKTFTITLKKLLLFGIPALVIFAALAAGLVIITGTLSDVQKELLDIEKELAEKVSRKELSELLAKRDIKDQLPDKENSPREKAPKFKEPYEKVMVNYFAAETWQDRLPFVLHPNTTEPLMKRHYGIGQFGKFEATNIIPYDGQSKVGIGEYIRLLVYYRDRQDGSTSPPHLYYVKRVRGGYKVDWEASMGKNPMSWKAYRAQRPTMPMLFRVVTNLTSYYNYEFGDAHRSYLSISFEDGTLVPIHGYVKRGSKSGKRIYEILKDGENHALIVKIRFLAGGDPSSNTVLIDELISEDWAMRNGEEFAQ